MRPVWAQKSVPHVWYVRLGPVELEVLADLALHASLFLSAVAMCCSSVLLLPM